MTEQEYFDFLEKLRVMIRQGKAKQTLPLLDEMFDIKPVRLKWNVVKAEAFAALGQWDAGLEVLFDIYHFTYVDKETHAYIQWYINWCLQKENILQADSCRYLQATLDVVPTITQTEFLLQTDQTLFSLEKQFLENPKDMQIAISLANSYFVANKHVEWTVLRCLVEKLSPDLNVCIPTETVFPQTSLNRDFICDRLKEANHTFVVSAYNENELQAANVLATAILNLGHQVILLEPALEYETTSTIDINSTVQISIDNLIERDGIIICQPIKTVNNTVIVDNYAPLLAQLSKMAENELLFLLSSSNSMDTFFMQPELLKCAERLTSIEMQSFSNHFNLGYVGLYTTYISYIYGFDVTAEMAKPSTCAISIIIPVRNSIDTLQHTLKTCCEQTFDDYEIVLSDNSSSGNTAIYDFVQTLNNPKIKYYRTPRELFLSRSFEFAFLKAKGEFLFSIGADDAVLPWGLDTISKTLLKHPNDDILEWIRGFYIWPNLKTKQQLGEFIIPNTSFSETPVLQRYSGLELISTLLANPSRMYLMPMLYINSGCRRRYLSVMLNKTGRMFAGNSQDIYTGIVNCTINETILFIQLPLTLAGMSGASVGASTKSDYIEFSYANQYSKDKRYGFTISPPLEQEVYARHTISRDIQYFYCQVIHAVCYGILSYQIFEHFNWDNIYQQIWGQYSKSQQDYDRILTSLAQQNFTFKEYGKHFDASLLADKMQPQMFKAPSNVPVGYVEGKDDFGNLTLDSRKYGITNIYEAVQFFNKTVGFKA